MTAWVLLPGLDGTGRLFDRFVACAPRGVEARAVGYPCDQPLDVEELAAQVQLPQEPFVLLGESFSGPVALRVAARRPRGLLGVVLVATFVTPPAWSALSRMPLEALFRMRPPRRALGHFLCAGDGALAARVAEAVGSVAPSVLAGRLRAVLSCDARGALAACDTSLLYLQATEDRVVPPRCGAEISDAGARLLRVEGPHLLVQANPRGAWDALERAGWIGGGLHG